MAASRGTAHGLLFLFDDDKMNVINMNSGDVGMRKSVISLDEKMSWWKGDLFTDDLIALAITKAYRDLMRTIRGFSRNPDHDIIMKNAKQTIYTSVTVILCAEIKTQSEFDELHKTACFELISSFRGQTFTVGQAQKWINMTFKNLHLLDYPKIQKVYEYCHIPVDSYMLNITNYTMSKAWSKLNDYHEYLEYQKWFRDKYPNSIPLDKEFYLWLEMSKSQK